MSLCLYLYEMSLHRPQFRETYSLEEYGILLKKYDSEMEKLKKEKERLILEMQKKYKLCLRCLKYNKLTTIESRSNCYDCSQKLLE